MSSTIDCFAIELQKLLNTMSMESASDTPDYVLAQYLRDCLDAFNRAAVYRDNHKRFSNKVKP